MDINNEENLLPRYEHCHSGDPHQIDVPYLDSLSNGLSYAADRLGQEEFTAVVPLTKGERSRMATSAAELL